MIDWLIDWLIYSLTSSFMLSMQYLCILADNNFIWVVITLYLKITMLSLFILNLICCFWLTDGQIVVNGKSLLIIIVSSCTYHVCNYHNYVANKIIKVHFIILCTTHTQCHCYTYVANWYSFANEILPNLWDDFNVKK